MGNVIKATRSKSGGGVQGLKHSFVTKLAISLEVVVWEYQQRGCCARLQLYTLSFALFSTRVQHGTVNRGE